jgi:hypothetical protein
MNPLGSDRDAPYLCMVVPREIETDTPTRWQAWLGGEQPAANAVANFIKARSFLEETIGDAPHRNGCGFPFTNRFPELTSPSFHGMLG